MALRLIQAGIGGMGRAWWHGAIKDHAGVELVAIVDIADAPLAECGDALGIPQNRRFHDLTEAVKAVDADAVLTVTPPPVHLKHAEIAFANGLHLLTEKPLGATLDEARQMVTLAKEANRQLVVSQNYRYNAPMATLRRLVADQPLGVLGHGHIDFYIPGDFRGTFRETMEFPLLVDMAIHHVDLIRAITGKNILKVTAQTFKPAWSWYQHHPGLKMLMELDDGVQFSYSGDWSARGRGTTWNGAWRLQCDSGSIEYTNDNKIQQTTSTFWSKDQTTTEFPHDAAPRNGQQAVLDGFIAAAATNTPAETSGADNLWSFGAVCAGVISAQQGRTVDVRELIGE
ncbi:MAG: Gfo/Idh/MocA family oxidoreductase [Burkholderiales bacterium]|nr:Gfo/Idh/MocA family oxidoreductase [Phycisphaerae bacterium]